MIYLDNAATTKMDPEVLEAMLPYMQENFFNPSAFYGPATKVRMKIENARREIAEFMGIDSNTIYFTSGGTESDNWAIRATALMSKDKGKHIITSSIEHQAVWHTMGYLRKAGYEITALPVDHKGMINTEDLKKAIRSDTILVSVMHANNEIGTIQPIEEIGSIASEKGIPFHTDAVQTFGHIPIDVKKSRVNFLSASAHKLNGPKGVGLLFSSGAGNIDKFMFGGTQEMGRRPGTENVAGIIGFAKAVELVKQRHEEDFKREQFLRKYFINELLSCIDGIYINGDSENCLPGIVSMTFPRLNSEVVLMGLDSRGICASAGSACGTGSIRTSPVLLACGKTEDEARRTLRFSLGRETTKKDLEDTVGALKEIFA